MGNDKCIQDMNWYPRRTLNYLHKCIPCYCFSIHGKEFQSDLQGIDTTEMIELVEL